jgi:hypothetical protein
MRVDGGKQRQGERVSDEQLDDGFYTRMLPPKERGVEAFGGLLNGLGAAIALGGIFILPLVLGTVGVLFAGTSLVTIRSQDAQKRFGIGFAIACAAWFIGFAHAAWASKKLY